MGFNDLSWTGDASPIDANDDGWPDIYLLNMQGHDEYYENQQGRTICQKESRHLFPNSPGARWASRCLTTTATAGSICM